MSARRTKITGIRQPVERIAGAVWTQLLSRINGQTGAVINIVLECELVTRDSVGEPNAKTEYWGDRDMTWNYEARQR